MKAATFSNGLETIDQSAFSETSLENVELPASLRKIAQGAFAKCESLRTVKFGDGLEALGSDEYQDNDNMLRGVFEKSSVESVDLPFTLKRIEYSAFKNCHSLISIELPQQLESIGK